MFQKRELCKRKCKKKKPVSLRLYFVIFLRLQNVIARYNENQM